MKKKKKETRTRVPLITYDRFVENMRGVARVQAEMEAKHGAPPLGHLTLDEIESIIADSESE